MGIQLQLAPIIWYALFTTSSALYSEWSEWSPCSSSCNGEQNRTRSCLVAFNLQACERKTQKRACNTSGCHPSSEVIITCAVLGALILLLLIVLIVILIKKRKNSHRFTSQKSRETALTFEKTAGKSQDINDDVEVKKENAQRTLSATPSTASQVTYLATDRPAEKTFQPWGEKDCDLF